MQKLNKKTVIILSIVIVAIMVAFCFALLNKNNKKGYDYYYTFKYDDNLISQTVEVYDSKGNIQSDYYVFYNDNIVTLTKADKAVLTIAKLDLKDHPDLEILFSGEKTRVKARYKK